MPLELAVNWDDVQTLVLRPAREESVAHLVLRVAPGKGGDALKQLACARDELPLTCGTGPAADGLHCTIGFTYRGLESLCVPPAYLRIFARLAPAFFQSAPLRSAQLGDNGVSARCTVQRRLCLLTRPPGSSAGVHNPR